MVKVSARFYNQIFGITIIIISKLLYKHKIIRDAEIILSQQKLLKEFRAAEVAKRVQGQQKLLKELRASRSC